MAVALPKLSICNVQVIPAKTDGAPNVFSQIPFNLEKRKWIPDNEVTTCLICQNKVSGATTLFC